GQLLDRRPPVAAAPPGELPEDVKTRSIPEEVCRDFAVPARPGERGREEGNLLRGKLARGPKPKDRRPPADERARAAQPGLSLADDGDPKARAAGVNLRQVDLEPPERQEPEPALDLVDRKLDRMRPARSGSKLEAADLETKAEHVEPEASDPTLQPRGGARAA